MPQMQLGDIVGLHHETHHRISQHFLQDEVGQRPARQLVPCPRMVQVGKGNGQSPRKSGMRYPGMKRHQDRGFPGFGIKVARRRTQLGFDVVLSPAGSVSPNPGTTNGLEKTATVLLVRFSIGVILTIVDSSGPRPV